MTGDTVDVDPDLLTPIFYSEGDTEGERKSVEDMTWDELQKYGFKLWWNDNKADLLKLFGIGGKYETTNIKFKFGTKPLGFFESLTERNLYWGTTTWAKRGTEEVDFNRGRSAIQPDFGIDQLDSYIYMNPDPGARPNGTHTGHEWYHFKIIFDAVKNGTKVPNALDQHNLIDLLNIPEIK